MGKVMAALNEGRLDRREAVKTLFANRADAIAVSGLGSPTYDLYSAGDSPANMYLWGAMGGCASVGLGVALAQPERPVVVVTGDGEQMMGLGSLVTIAVKNPPNLTIVVLDNGRYLETGGQKSHTGLGVDFSELGKAAGLEVISVATREELEQVAATIGRVGNRPRLIHVGVSAEPAKPVLPPRDGVWLKHRLRQYLEV